MYNPNENRFGDSPNGFAQPPMQNMPRMAGASMTCSIIGIVTAMTGFFPIILGGLAVLFACLSKGAADNMPRQARYGFIIGLVAMGIGIAVTVVTFAMAIVQYGSLANYVNSAMEMYYDMMGGSFVSLRIM